MDVHKDTITVAVLPGLAKAPTRLFVMTSPFERYRWLEGVLDDCEAELPNLERINGYLDDTNCELTLNGREVLGSLLRKGAASAPIHGKPIAHATRRNGSGSAEW